MTCDPNTTGKPLEEIDRLLAEFEERLPALLDDVEEWQLAESFAGEADHILRMTRDEDYEEACGRLHTLAERHRISQPAE